MAMEKMGFAKFVDSSMKQYDPLKCVYEKPSTQERAYFFAIGKGAYWQAEDGPYYFNTVQELMQFLWDKYSPNIKDENWLKDYLRKWLM